MHPCRHVSSRPKLHRKNYQVLISYLKHSSILSLKIITICLISLTLIFQWKHCALHQGHQLTLGSSTKQKTEPKGHHPKDLEPREPKGMKFAVINVAAA